MDMGEIRETFLLYDTRGDSRIEARMIGEVVRALGLNPTEAEVQRCGYSSDSGSLSTSFSSLPTLPLHSLSHFLPHFLQLQFIQIPFQFSLLC